MLLTTDLDSAIRDARYHSIVGELRHLTGLVRAFLADEAKDVRTLRRIGDPLPIA